MVFLVLVGRRAAAARAVAVFLATVVVGFLLVPASAADYWTHTVWDAGRVGGIEYVRNQSVNGVLTRLLGEEPSTALWFAVAAPLAGAVLLLAAAVWRRGDRDVAVLLAAGSMLLASPISWDHHWVWAAPALLVLVRRAHPVLTGLWALPAPGGLPVPRSRGRGSRADLGVVAARPRRRLRVGAAGDRRSGRRSAGPRTTLIGATSGEARSSARTPWRDRRGVA